MKTEKFAAHTENRTFYFYVNAQNEQQITITMYNTSYTLIKNEDAWENHPSNYFSMAKHLSQAVVYSVTNHIMAD